MSSLNAKEFLDYIGRDAQKTMFRSFAQKGVEYENKPFPGKHRTAKELEAASGSGASIYYNLCKFPPTFNGHRPGTKEELLAESVTWDLFVAEWDDGSSKEQQLEMIAEAGLPTPSFHVDTGGKSLHWYWLLDEEITAPGIWEIIQGLILEALPSSDQQIKDCTRVMRLPGFPHPETGRIAELVKGDESPARYSLEDFPDPEEEKERQLKAIDAQVLEAVALQKHANNSRLILENKDSDFVSALDYLAPYANEFNGSASWFTVMCAIRDAGDYLFLAHRFCEGMKDYNAEEIDQRWNRGDFDPKPDKITKATIFKLAAERGWKNPAIGRTPEYTQDNTEVSSGGAEGPLLGEEELEYDQEQAACELKGSKQQLGELDYIMLMPGELHAAAKDVWAHRTIAPSMLFPAMLTAASVAIGHGHTWRLLEIGDFVENPRIWALVIAGSGSDKSSVNGLTCGVLKQLDRTDYNDRKNAEDELEAHKRLKGESEAMKVERFEMEKNLAPRRERFISDNASYKGMIETLANGNADGVLHFFDETTEHFRRLADKKSNPDNWNPSAEINLYDGKKTGFRNRGEQVIVEDGFLYNRLANIQPEPLSKVFQLSEGQGTWARWLFFRTAPRRTVLEDFVKSAQAETAFKELWEPIMWSLVQMEGTTWMPATHEDFEAFTEASVGTESMKHDQAPVTKAFYSKARGGIARLVLIFAAIRVATYGGTVGEWISDDVTRAMMLYQGCAEELGSFASKHQDSESRWSAGAKDLLEKPWLREQSLGAQLKTGDIQRNCKIHGLKSKDYKALFEELAGTLPHHFEVWNEGRSGGLVIKQYWYNGA